MRGTSYEGTKPAGGDDTGGNPGERRVALVIGNGAYRNTRPLANPANDAAAIAAALERHHFTVIGGPRDGLNLTYGALFERIRDFGRRLRDADTALFFYAGHGMQVAGQNYLVPVDAACTHELDVHEELIDVTEVLKRMEQPDRTSLVFLDACRDNPLAQNLAQAMGFGSGRDAGIGAGLAEQKTREGTLIAFATQPGNIAYDGEGQNSYFTQAILEQIEAAPQRDVELLMRDVRVRVRALTESKERGPQIPWLHTSLLGPFTFAPSASKPAPETPATGPAPILSFAERDWARFEIARTEDVAVIEAYIAQYERSEPLWAVSARQRLSEVQALLNAREEEARQDALAEGRVELPLSDGGSAWSPPGFADVLDQLQQKGEYEPVRLMVGTGAEDREMWIAPGSGESFRDADFAPEMVVVPAGSFMMGSSESEEGRYEDEGPQHEVRIPEPFAVGRFAVTFAESDAAQADPDWQRVTGLEPRKPEDRGWGRGNHPVINVSWDDAQAYAQWLSEKTGKTYRLLSEAEWEYAARAGTTSRYWFGDDDSELGEHAWYRENSGEKTHPVGEKTANPWGLHDVHGNVWEWVEDCWNDSYANKPERLKASDAAWTSADCNRRVRRGGSWFNGPQDLRSASRVRIDRGDRSFINGFRLARTITP
jgi:formylglycine-generating enzyme required for sulfatase activity